MIIATRVRRAAHNPYALDKKVSRSHIIITLLFLVCVSSEMFLHIISLSKIFAKAFGKSHHSYLQNTSTKYFCQLVLSTKCII